MKPSRGQRAFDLVGATGGLVAFGPVMAAVALAILLDDGGPIFFRQSRIGWHRQPFDILKFRTMRDGQVTRVGQVIRATGLDEVPQFVNILRGDMSAVGPRPLTAEDVTRLGWNDPRFDFRWSCRPGLTGLAQLLGSLANQDALLLDRAHASGFRLTRECELVAWSFAVNAFGKARVRAWLRRRYARQLSGSVESTGQATASPDPAS